MNSSCPFLSLTWTIRPFVSLVIFRHIHIQDVLQIFSSLSFLFILFYFIYYIFNKYIGVLKFSGFFFPGYQALCQTLKDFSHLEIISNNNGKFL